MAKIIATKYPYKEGSRRGPVPKSVLEPFYILFVISYRYVLIVFLDRVVSSERTVNTRWYDCTVGR